MLFETGMFIYSVDWVSLNMRALGISPCGRLRTLRAFGIPLPAFAGACGRCGYILGRSCGSDYFGIILPDFI